MEGHGRSRKVKEVCVACKIIVSAQVSVPFLWTLDLGFGTWIWDLDLGPDLGLTIFLFLRIVKVTVQ